MEELLKKTYHYYEDKLQKLLDEISATKDILNGLAKDIGMPVPYPENTKEVVKGINVIKRGQFYSKPLATAVREYLRLRNEPIHWEDIISALKQGDYIFDRPENDARLSIVRNTNNFVLLPDNYFALKEWYPKLKKDRPKFYRNGTLIEEVNDSQDCEENSHSEKISWNTDSIIL